MRLTDYTDYALRVLMHLGSHPGQTITIREIATVHGISHNHLSKIVYHLGQLGVLTTLRGRAGGIQLARPPEQIMLGDVIRLTEPDFQMVECFSERDNTCILAGRCKLRDLLAKATFAYLERLDQVPLSALLSPCSSIAKPHATAKRPARTVPRPARPVSARADGTRT
ncbi:RrF2 family transcriptional regulator [Massilia endophytica]|uniref:RrF2 family transcriptional regulator n=1 Tax=Massilia endophytica TaxID=2899220 RepID=UPI001E486810|nr:Rrf2 family transcriptional regulator [Massilia endophytica]UGQ46407.1 Rrf2 family transcriptional regulator [Massilia endophytica]